MSITMTELAKRLDLSQSTISRALNYKDGGRMKPELAARIREAARQAGFHPNQAAATLRTGASKMIGVSLPTPRNLRNAELAAALHHEIISHGYLPFFAFHEKRISGLPSGTTTCRLREWSTSFLHPGQMPSLRQCVCCQASSSCSVSSVLLLYITRYILAGGDPCAVILHIGNEFAYHADAARAADHLRMQL